LFHSFHAIPKEEAKLVNGSLAIVAVAVPDVAVPDNCLKNSGRKLVLSCSRIDVRSSHPLDGTLITKECTLFVLSDELWHAEPGCMLQHAPGLYVAYELGLCVRYGFDPLQLFLYSPSTDNSGKGIVGAERNFSKLSALHEKSGLRSFHEFVIPVKNVSKCPGIWSLPRLQKFSPSITDRPSLEWIHAQDKKVISWRQPTSDVPLIHSHTQTLSSMIHPEIVKELPDGIDFIHYLRYSTLDSAALEESRSPVTTLLSPYHLEDSVGDMVLEFDGTGIRRRPWKAIEGQIGCPLIHKYRNLGFEAILIHQEALSLIKTGNFEDAQEKLRALLKLSAPLSDSTTRGILISLAQVSLLTGNIDDCWKLYKIADFESQAFQEFGFFIQQVRIVGLA
jgi:hypothetical protein